MAHVQIPHLSIPFRFQHGFHAETAEQNTLEEITMCVEAIVRCPLGYRIERPEFGMPDQTFMDPPDVVEVGNTVALWEPRALEHITQEYIEDLAYRIKVEVSRKETIG